LEFTASLLMLLNIKGLAYITSRVSLLVVTLGKVLYGVPLFLSGWTSSGRWQLDFKIEMVTLLALGKGHLENKFRNFNILISCKSIA